MPHLLIVEDEPTTSWALAEGLADDGYTIDTFRTAEDALAWLKTNRSDLVISAGVAECFSKPFAVDALRRSVRRAIANADARRAGMKKAA